MGRIILIAFFLTLWCMTITAWSGEFQVSIGTTAVKVVSTDQNRRSLTIKAHDGNSGTVYCRSADANVNSVSGFEFGAGASYTWDITNSAQSEKWCVGSAASQTVSVEESRQ